MISVHSEGVYAPSNQDLFSKAKGDKPRNCLVPRAEAKLLKSPQSPQSSELHLRFETGKGPDPEITTKKGQSSVQ